MPDLHIYLSFLAARKVAMASIDLVASLQEGPERE
jgi:hypothetical protein